MSRDTQELRQRAADARDHAARLQRQIDALWELKFFPEATELRRAMAGQLRFAVESEAEAEKLERERYRAERECTSEPLHPRSPAPRLIGDA